jgi:hypothetical protein
MTTTEQGHCAVCGNGMERLPWGATVHPEKRAAIELDGYRFPVHRECIRVFVLAPTEDAEGWEQQLRSAVPVGDA